jgi:hypothetical protein
MLVTGHLIRLHCRNGPSSLRRFQHCRCEGGASNGVPMLRLYRDYASVAARPYSRASVEALARRSARAAFRVAGREAKHILAAEGRAADGIGREAEGDGRAAEGIGRLSSASTGRAPEGGGRAPEDGGRARREPGFGVQPGTLVALFSNHDR